MMPSVGDRLSPQQRVRSIERLRESRPDAPLDLIVVGGGVVGAGAALDAATRGLEVALVEQADLASGTSSRSSRLAHGGLRYLEHREFALVREALAERGLLLDRIAPHLVRPLQFLLPLTRAVERSYFGAGVTLYDLLSRAGAYGGSMPRPRTLSRAAVKGLAPALDSTRISGAIRFHDAQIDDARHVVALARTAVSHGAAVVTGARVSELITDPITDEAERVVGVRVEVDGESIAGYARCVLSATGVWTDNFFGLANVSGAHTQVRQSKGVHIIVPKDRIRSGSAIIARTSASVLFLLPWGDNWLIGTTDTDYDAELEDPTASPEDVDYLLEQANRWLVDPLTLSDIVGVYCGLRPLVATEVVPDGSGSGTTAISREHVVMNPKPGLVMVAGGKYTTYRVMAQDAVDAAAAERAAFVPGSPPKCVTRDVVVVGGQGFEEMWASRARLAREWNLDEEQVAHLLRRHGDRTPEVVQMIAENVELGQRIHPQAPYLQVEVVVAVSHEGARSLADVLVRRTRVALETADAGVDCAGEVAELMAPLLGWSPRRTASEVANYEATAREQLGSWKRTL